MHGNLSIVLHDDFHPPTQYDTNTESDVANTESDAVHILECVALGMIECQQGRHLKGRHTDSVRLF